jgi:hypothetical protein
VETSLAQSCTHHPARRGFALCMSCRKVVCQECATTWDGVNHCRPCLAKRGAVAAPRRHVGGWIVWATICVVLLLAAGRAMAWSAAMLARWW